MIIADTSRDKTIRVVVKYNISSHSVKSMIRSRDRISLRHAPFAMERWSGSDAEFNQEDRHSRG